ncbi:MAG: YfhO family protein [Endomicrobia bacterium]|nr:YfhO family protein [Endomicrobiia bacterium]
MKRRYRYFIVLTLIVIPLFFFHKIIFTELTYFQRDVILQFKPWKVFINKVVSKIWNYKTDYTDFIPLWNPYNHCGAPLMANLQSQVFYPLSIVFYLIKDFAAAYKIFILLHCFLSMLFMFLLLRHKKLGYIPAITGAIIWSLNGFMISRIEFLSVFATIVWLPLLIFLLERTQDNFNFKKIIMLSFAIAIQFLAGHAQMWVYSIFFLICYSLFFCFKFRTSRPLYSLLLSIIMSVLLSSIQALPTLEFLLHSTRIGQQNGQFGMSYQQAAFGSLKFSDLFNFFYPFNWQFTFSKVSENTSVLTLSHYWIFTFYIGFLGMILTILGFIKSKYKTEKIFYLTIVVITILFSLGENFILYELVYTYLPISRIFRHPAVIIYIVMFIFAIFCAEGVQTVKHISKKYRILKIFLYLLPILSFMELFFYSTKISMLLPKSILDEKRELINFLMEKSKSDNLPYRFAHTPLTQKVATTTLGKSLYDTFAKYRDKLFSNINLEYELYNFRGQDIELTNYHKFMNFVYSRKSLDDAIPYLSIANVKYILSVTEQKTSLANLVKLGEIKVYENPFVLPQIYPVTKIIVEYNIEKSLELIKSLGNEVFDTVIIHTKENTNFVSQQNQPHNFTIHKLEVHTNKIFSLITTSSPVFLVISQNYYPGWHCIVDGIKTKIYHCNIFMSGIYVKEGTHEINLYYSPNSFKIGCIITLLTLLMCCLYIFEKS